VDIKNRWITLIFKASKRYELALKCEIATAAMSL
jgi:hypothetical protein